MTNENGAPVAQDDIQAVPATKGRSLNSAQANRAAHRIAARLIEAAIDAGSQVIENGLDGYAETAQSKVREALNDMIDSHDHKSV